MQFTWEFPQFIVVPDQAGLQQVVTGINWVCTGTDGTATSSSSGRVNLYSPNRENFIPYADITYQIAYEWVAQSISMQGVQNEIAVQIGRLSQPVTQTQNPPF
jgi:hypothetical protein